MEKLFLRGVMYGADKIPDTWFDRLPGNYYKAKAQEQEQDARMNSQNRQDNRDRRRYSDAHDYRQPEYDDRKDRHPRHDDHSQRRDDDRRRDSHRNGSSHDKEDRRYSTNDRPRDSKRGHNDDRYGNNGGSGRQGKDRPSDDEKQSRRDYRQPRDDSARRDNGNEHDTDRRYDDGEHDTGRRYDDNVDGPTRDQPSPLAAAVEGAFAAGVAAAHLKGDIKTPNPGAVGEKPSYTGYVPYSDIYGSNNGQDAAQKSFSPPPTSSIGSAQPHSMNQVSPPRRGTLVQHNNEHDRQYSKERAYRSGYDGQNDDPSDRQNNTPYNRRDDDRYNGGPDERASRNRSQRPDLRSRSYDSYDHGDRRRDLSQRQGEGNSERRDRGKSSSRLSTAFDKSKRGLGYSAVGAAAGGLVGSGVGKGVVPTTIGAVLGGIGANIFEARERRKESARNIEYSQDEGGTERREQRGGEKRERKGDWKD